MLRNNLSNLEFTPISKEFSSVQVSVTGRGSNCKERYEKTLVKNMK